MICGATGVSPVPAVRRPGGAPGSPPAIAKWRTRDDLLSMKKAFPILGVLTAILLSYALYEALVAAPTEQTMGEVQRIFYYHVPSAWTAFILFFVNFGASVFYLT